MSTPSPLHDKAVAAARAAANAYWESVTEEITEANCLDHNAKARAAGYAAARPLYLAAGYHECRVQTCERLAGPSYALCPVHGQPRA